jgi:hypothetical protein
VAVSDRTGQNISVVWLFSSFRQLRHSNPSRRFKRAIYQCRNGYTLNSWINVSTKKSVLQFRNSHFPTLYHDLSSVFCSVDTTVAISSPVTVSWNLALWDFTPAYPYNYIVNIHSNNMWIQESQQFLQQLTPLFPTQSNHQSLH